MQIAIVLILCCGVSLISALPEPRQMVTKSFKNDGSLATLFAAINYGSVRAVQEIIGGRNVNDSDANGVTALHVAAIKGNEEMAELLIKNGADVNKKIEGSGVTPLHVAANNGNDKFARTLIKNGANVNSVDANGVSSLQLAVFEDYKRVVDLLIKNGADVNHQDLDGKSVLHWAAAKASDSVAEQLINSGAKSVSVLDNVGKTPLYYATLAGNTAFADVLVNFLASGCQSSSFSVIGILISITFSLIV